MGRFYIKSIFTNVAALSEAVRFAGRASAMLTSRISMHAIHARLRAFPMNCRTRFLITSLVLCHLLVAPGLVTSQLRTPEKQSQVVFNAPSALDREEITISATEKQEKDGPIYKLKGQVEIHYGQYVLYGDEITYNQDTGDAVADGHVVLDGGTNNEHLQATHGIYNTRTQTGKFVNVVGTI